MRRCLAVIAVLFAFTAFAETLSDFDRRIEQELTALNPKAVDAWHRANAARAAGRHDEAMKSYAEVYGTTPQFVHALRRMAGEELVLGKVDDAKMHMRGAVAAQRSSVNLAAMASILLEAKPTQAELVESMSLAMEAQQMKPDDPFPTQVVAQAALASEDLELLRKSVARLEQIDPKSPQTPYFRFFLQANQGEWSAAEASLAEARALGLPAEAYDSSYDSLQKAKPIYIRWGIPALKIVLAWFVVFGLLLVAGVVLSRVAMRAAHQPPAQLAENSTGLSGRVRKIYAAVLTLSCVFYYLSIPIVLLTVVVIGGAAIYGFFAIGQIPVKLLLLVVVVVGVSVWSMLKSLFIRATDEEPGAKLDLAKQPKLRGLLDAVAKQIGTRAVDNVYLTPGTEVAVMERGKRSRRERCLILGVAALDGFRMRPFRAVLGHEYGHFSNKDTAGGAFALAVRRSLGITAIGLVQGGAAAWYNPAWLFVNGFHRVFLRISEGASRLQEILADRWAVFAYGAAAFEEGLRHVIEQSVRFDAHVGATLKEVVDRNVPLANLYTYKPSLSPQHVDQKIEEAFKEEGSVYDSHPPASQRFALAHALPQRRSITSPDDDEPVWSLFENRDELQAMMTTQVRANVQANYGVVIAGD